MAMGVYACYGCLGIYGFYRYLEIYGYVWMATEVHTYYGCLSEFMGVYTERNPEILLHGRA